MSALHSDALALLTTWAAPDDSQELLRRQYVAHLVRHPDGLSRSCLPDHITASTLVLSADCQQVLLTLHGKARQWFQFGGHVEPGDVTLSGAALREATEESGIPELKLHRAPIHLDTHVVPFCGSPGTRHLDVRFVAVASAVVTPEVSSESVDVRWWPVEELPTDEPSMRRLVDLGRDRLRRV